MKISKKDALLWFSFFAQLDEEEELLPKQMELVYATFAQIEDTIDARNEKLMAEIKGLKSIGGRTYFVGPEIRQGLPFLHDGDRLNCHS